MKTFLLATVVAGALTGFGIASARADDPFGTAGATSVYNTQATAGDPYVALILNQQIAIKRQLSSWDRIGTRRQ